MLLKFYKIIAACAQNFIQITLFWDRKEGSSLLCSALKRDDYFCGRRFEWGVLFCISHFGGLGLAVERFKGDSLSRLASQAVLKGSVCFAGGGSVEPIGLEKAMRSISR